MKHQRSRLRAVLIGAAFAGAGVSLFLSIAGASNRLGAIFARTCGAGVHFDCGAVIASRWGRIGPVPTATWGFVYFTFVLLWYFVAGLPNRAGRIRHLPLCVLVIGGGGLASGLLVFVMLFRLTVLCPWCLVTHALNGVIIIGTWRAWPRSTRDTDSDARAVGDQPRPSIGRIAAVFAIGAAGSLAVLGVAGALLCLAEVMRTRQTLLDATNNVEFIRWRFSTTQPALVPVRGDEFIAGDRDAPHTLVVFSDFECPLCREFESVAHQFVERYPSRLRVVFKYYPMSRACAQVLPEAQDIHRYACEAAHAAEAARRTGSMQQAWHYRELLRARAEELAARPWTLLASQAGLDAERFAEAFRSSATADRVSEDMALGVTLAIPGSGTMYLDDRRLYAWRIIAADLPLRTDEDTTWRLWDLLLRAQEPPDDVGERDAQTQRAVHRPNAADLVGLSPLGNAVMAGDRLERIDSVYLDMILAIRGSDESADRAPVVDDCAGASDWSRRREAAHGFDARNTLAE